MTTDMETPAVLKAFVDACISLADCRDLGGVTRLMSDLVADEQRLAELMPKFPEPEPSRRGWRLGGEHVCHQNTQLTVMVLDTLPGVLQPPHDHTMPVVIGVFEGCEDQRFFARSDAGLVPTAGRSLEAGDVISMGERAVHAISSPVGRPARAVHVYFGDIYAVDRSLFHPDSLEELVYSADRYDELCRPAESME